MKRQIIKIDEEKCTGCGLCIPNCPEGALQVIDGKARLISDLFCDGLGACLGHCPEGAILVEEREAEEYDECRVMENVVKQGDNVILAHLKHLKEHDQEEFLNQALGYLKDNSFKIPEEFAENKTPKPHVHHAGCPRLYDAGFQAGKGRNPCICRMSRLYDERFYRCEGSACSTPLQLPESRSYASGLSNFSFSIPTLHILKMPISS